MYLLIYKGAIEIENTKITFSIPLPVDYPDCNGYMFSQEAIHKLCSQELNIPIVDKRNDKEVVIGHCIGSPSYLNGYLFIDGMQYGNGLEFVCKDTSIDENGIKIINEFEISGYSFDTIK